MIDSDGVRVGIDIGTSKTAVIISQRDELDNKLLILGVGYSSNTGLRKGKIVNIESAIKSIKKAADDAILMAGVEFDSVNINIAGEIESINSNGIVGISNKDKEVNFKDIQRVIKQAQHRELGHDKTVLHIFPQNFKLDEQDNIKDPIGMTGMRLEGSVHLITAPKINLTNIVKCIRKAGFTPREALATGFASANAVLNEEDKYSGSLLLDIGAGTTDIMAFLDGYPVLSSVVLLGGQNLTKDLSHGLKVSDSLAEKIKRKFGCVYSGVVDPVEEIEIPMYGKNHVERISKERINSILEPRAEEIFLMVKKKIEERGYNLDYFGNGCVIVGGTAKMAGITELAEKILGISTRIGQPANVGGIVDEIRDPSFIASIGICMGEDKYFEGSDAGSEKDHLLSGKSGNFMKKMGSFIKEIFG